MARYMSAYDKKLDNDTKALNRSPRPRHRSPSPINTKKRAPSRSKSPKKVCAARASLPMTSPTRATRVSPAQRIVIRHDDVPARRSPPPHYMNHPFPQYESDYYTPYRGRGGYRGKNRK